jgi:cytochrome c553
MLEAVIVLACCALAASLALAAPGERARAASLVLAAALCGLAFAASRAERDPGHAALRPADRTAESDTDYVSSTACRSCHPGEYESWRESYHRRMTQPASAETIVAPFDGSELVFQERTYRLWREDDRFLVDMPKFGTEGFFPEDRMQSEVVMVTGSHHLQAYWVPMPQGESVEEAQGRQVFNASCASCHGRDGEGGKEVAVVGMRLLPDEVATPILDGHGGLDAVVLDDNTRAKLEAWLVRVQFDGRLLQFPWVYAVQQGVWLHEENSFLQPTPPFEAPERPGDRWGFSCDECHSVRPRFEWQGRGSEARSAAVELGIACEACHGPGREHVEQARDPRLRYASHLADRAASSITNPANLDPVRSSHVCAQCHGDIVRKAGGYLDFKPGDDITERAFFVRYSEPPYPKYLADELAEDPTRLEDAFWRDGTVRIAGRDYNGLLETACHTDGEMSCISCHSMHHGEPDDQLSQQMRTNHACTQCHAEMANDVEKHTHHPADSSGSLCFNCHMPHTTYGLMKAIRAHRVDSPSAAKNLSSGRPNACNLCHLDKKLGDVAGDLHRWYGQKEPEVPAVYSDVAASLVWLLRGDAVTRGITAWHMGWQPALEASGRGWQAPHLAGTLDDPYVAVRFVAWQSLLSHPGFEGGLDFAFAAEDDAALERASDDAMARAREAARPFVERPQLLLHPDEARDAERVARLERERDDTEVRVAE